MATIVAGIAMKYAFSIFAKIFTGSIASIILKMGLGMLLNIYLFHSFLTSSRKCSS